MKRVTQKPAKVEPERREDVEGELRRSRATNQYERRMMGS